MVPHPLAPRKLKSRVVGWVSRSALDCTRDPRGCMKEIVKVVRDGGPVYCKGFEREGTNGTAEEERDWRYDDWLTLVWRLEDGSHG